MPWTAGRGEAMRAGGTRLHTGRRSGRLEQGAGQGSRVSARTNDTLSQGWSEAAANSWCRGSMFFNLHLHAVLGIALLCLPGALPGGQGSSKREQSRLRPGRQAVGRSVASIRAQEVILRRREVVSRRQSGRLRTTHGVGKIIPGAARTIHGAYRSLNSGIERSTGRFRRFTTWIKIIQQALKRLSEG